MLQSAPPWLWAAGLALVAFTAAVLAEAVNEVARLSASALRLVIEGAAFLWAAGRLDLPVRFRQALLITGWTSLLTAVTYLLMLPPELGGPHLISDLLDALFTVGSYVGTVAALLVYPRAAAHSRERTSLVIDLVITAGGLGFMSWALVTVPSAARTGGLQAFAWVIIFGVAQLSLVAVLNLVVVRGVVIPSRRAFWWFVAGQAAYLPVLVLTQFEEAGYIDTRWSSVAYFLGVLPTLVAAACIRSDAMTTADAGTRPAWIADFNPLPLVTPLAVGAGLLFALVVGPSSATLPLAATLMVVSLLLALRLLLSARGAAALARAEAEAERRRQRDKMQAVARLAGGVAHEFNNLMTRVMGHADLGEDMLAPGADARLEFQRIRAAAERAAALTSQLLAFSGRQRARLDRLDLAAWIRAGFPAVVSGLPPGVDAELQVRQAPVYAWADGSQLAIALAQVAANAAEAMPGGGRLAVELASHDLDHVLATPLLRVPAGRYAVVHVRDTGRGIPPEHLAAICEPFFSTKAPHLAAGLGLASVYGIVAAHGGGLAVDSEVGAGTTVSIYLPRA
ncbi:MAG: sensor histidine kinase [Vicinamibacterales bacterium]